MADFCKKVKLKRPSLIILEYKGYLELEVTQEGSLYRIAEKVTMTITDKKTYDTLKKEGLIAEELS